jgi:hypothetical protein
MERATWYLGGGRSIDTADGVCVAFLGCDAAGEGSARWEGRSGLGSGGCALSDSVMASAAARSAARAASCGVVGAAGGACDGAVGFEDVAGGMEGSASCQFPSGAGYRKCRTYSHRIISLRSRSGSAGGT